MRVMKNTFFFQTAILKFFSILLSKLLIMYVGMYVIKS